MAKKKVANAQSQSLDHKTLTPQPTTTTADDSSVQIQNLKNLNNVLLKETTNHRNRIQELLHSSHTAMDAEARISEKNFALEIEKSVFFVFARAHFAELGFCFDKVVEERDERKYEVDVQKEKVSELVLSLENEKRNVEKIRLEGERRIEELEKDRDLVVKKSIESEKVIDELKEKIDLLVKEKNEIENVNNTRGRKIFDLERELQQHVDLLKNSRKEEELMRVKIVEMEETIGLAVEKEREMMVENSNLVGEKKEMEKSIESLTEARDGVFRKLDVVQRELENRQREVDEANRARDEIEKVKVSGENEIIELLGEVSRLRGVVDKLEKSCKEVEEKNVGLWSQVNHYRNAIQEVESMNELNSKKFEEEKNKVESYESQAVVMKEKIDQLLSQVLSYKSAVDEVVIERDNIKKGYDEEQSKVKNMESQVVAMEKKIEQLLAQVQCSKNAVDEVVLERDNIRKGYDEEQTKVGNLELQVAELKLEKDTVKKGYEKEKSKVENLESQVAGLKEKIGNAEADLAKIRSEKEKMNEKNKGLGGRVDVLTKEKDAAHSSLIAAQRECDELRAKFDSSRIVSKQALELLKSTAAAVVVKESAEVIPRSGKKKHEKEEIQSFAEELEAIKKAFKVKNEAVDQMKLQVVSLQKSVSDAHSGKHLWTGISSAATAIFAAAFTAYITTKGR
ncbi:cilia- and flagella-associated protein 58-like [Vicia villosa]|uniref:cilia- and flagella-associated protein 58-like n=1 Tax=Vicia villosa TaxID=3911 RepID=UPI00273C3B70|nr:cilia- and flagella-associated protein 58-like [Vicia villosa]